MDATGHALFLADLTDVEASMVASALAAGDTFCCANVNESAGVAVETVFGDRAYRKGQRLAEWSYQVLICAGPMGKPVEDGTAASNLHRFLTAMGGL